MIPDDPALRCPRGADRRNPRHREWNWLDDLSFRGKVIAWMVLFAFLALLIWTNPP